ncbi:MAG: SPFH domain-containing protein [Patescibacteria group bacterium]
MKKFALIVVSVLAALLLLPIFALGLLSGEVSYSLIFLSFAVFVVGAMILQGLRRISADPPEVALCTRLGKPIPKVKESGWRLFLFYPWLYGFILLPAGRHNFDVTLEKAVTPDNVPSKIPVSMTITINYKDPRHLLNFILVGGMNGVIKQLTDMTLERLREWARSDGEGPQTWEELLAASLEASCVLLRAILPKDVLQEIPCKEVPTWILLKYFNEPQILPTKSEEVRWRKNWSRVRSLLQKAGNADAVRTAVNERRAAVLKARQGTASFAFEQFGITLNRLSVGEIKTLGKVAEIAENVEVERQHRKAETVELDHVRKRANELMSPVAEGGLGLTKQEAMETIFVERGKVEKKVNETKFSADPTTLEMMSDLIPKVVNEVAAAIAMRRAS